MKAPKDAGLAYARFKSIWHSTPSLDTNVYPSEIKRGGCANIRAHDGIFSRREKKK